MPPKEYQYHPSAMPKPNETPREELLERDVAILFREVRSLREEIGVLKEKLKRYEK